MTSVRLIATAAFALLSVGTLSLAANAAAQATTVAPATGHSDAMMAACPMNVPGTKVTAVDTANGETLLFTTTDDVAALRSKVRRMAEMHNQHHATGGAHDGMMGGEMMGGGKGMDGKMMVPPSNATVTDVERGASIALTPVAPADLQKLQTAVRTHAKHMEQDGCGKMAHAK
jgi:hypothetical protein